jgi:hypothetical protein
MGYDNFPRSAEFIIPAPGFLVPSAPITVPVKPSPAVGIYIAGMLRPALLPSAGAATVRLDVAWAIARPSVA